MSTELQCYKIAWKHSQEPIDTLEDHREEEVQRLLRDAYNKRFAYCTVLKTFVPYEIAFHTICDYLMKPTRMLALHSELTHCIYPIREFLAHRPKASKECKIKRWQYDECVEWVVDCPKWALPPVAGIVIFEGY